jgi:hypothetical protein
MVKGAFYPSTPTQESGGEICSRKALQTCVIRGKGRILSHEKQHGLHSDDHSGIDSYLSSMRTRNDGDHAGRRLPLVLRVYGLPCSTPAENGRLLCVLFLRDRSLPTRSGIRQRPLLLSKGRFAVD